MEQISLFPESKFWIPEVDSGCRMWRCPVCSGRMIGQPLHWFQFNFYNFCPYCGTALYTHESDLKKVDDLL